MGVNLLGRDLESVMFAVAREKLHGFWTDDAEYKPFPTAGLWFGSVAFKYRALIAAHNYGAVARQAVAIGVDVVTTSGPGTGRAPDVSKIQTMSEALGGHPLAIASGITPENVEAFLPFAQAYLVATGIEREFGEFDAARVKALADKYSTKHDAVPSCHRASRGRGAQAGSLFREAHPQGH